MRRRLLAAVAALVLALVGTVVLVAYAQGADQRAMAGLSTVPVLVVDQIVPEGTRAEDLGALVRAEELPAKAAVDLQPGEQLLASRFAAPESLQTPGTVAVPAGTEEVSVLLDPQRAVGGRLVAGDEVGVFISLDPAATHAVLHHVLVTQVQGAPAPIDPEADTETASAASAVPTGSLLVTLALTGEQAEGVVFGAEHGTLWLSLEPDDANLDGTEVITPDNVYGKDWS